MDQVHEYENLVADVLSEGMKMCDVLQANVLLEKFPPSWSEYLNHLKHKKNDMNLQELISHMRTEEANRLKDKEISNSSISFKANLVESSPSRKDRLQPKGKKFQKGGQQKTFKGNDGKIQKTKAPAPQNTSAPTKNYSKTFRKHVMVNASSWAIPPPQEFWVKGRSFLNLLPAKL
ncbi:UNVERIFIED_CONTAM: hypothetical protein Sangu_2514600 [Sesamum angustifolium]|uniref:Gag/pol protein n=1 Tax=Sesamum angustifolium TaxID=2727405 RepID=A0AAW2JKG3_9LAMI